MLSAPSLLPTTAVLEMTWRCNHRCRFCSCPWESGQLTPTPELSIAEWKEATSELARAGVTHFTFTGGEAILKEGLPELIEHVASLRATTFKSNDAGVLIPIEAHPTMNLLSNGRNIDDAWIQRCVDHDMLLSLSLPGLRTLREHIDADTSPEWLLSRFARAQELGCATCVGVAVTKRNLPELYEIIASAFLAGASSLLLNRFLPGGRGLSIPEWELTPAEVIQAADIAESILTRTRRTGHFGTELPLCLIDPTKYKALHVSIGCSAARDFFCVSPDGWIRACNHSPVKLVHWRDHAKLNQHPDWMHYLRNDILPATCTTCADAIQCRGGCREAARVTTGDLAAPDPIFRHLSTT